MKFRCIDTRKNRRFLANSLRETKISSKTRVHDFQKIPRDLDFFLMEDLIEENLDKSFWQHKIQTKPEHLYKTRGFKDFDMSTIYPAEKNILTDIYYKEGVLVIISNASLADTRRKIRGAVKYYFRRILFTNLSAHLKMQESEFYK